MDSLYGLVERVDPLRLDESQKILDTMSDQLSRAYLSGRDAPLDDLCKSTYETLRNFEFENESTQNLVSKLCATPMNDVVSSSVLSVVLGFVSSVGFTTMLSIGGVCIANITFAPGVMQPAFVKDGVSWPLVNPRYHEMRLMNVPKGASVHAIGARTLKAYESVINASQVPGSLLFFQGSCYCVTCFTEVADLLDSRIPRWRPLL